MYDAKPAFDDLARVKGKKELTAKDIANVKAHLQELKNQYLQYKLNAEVLQRQYEKQCIESIKEKFQPEYDRQRPVDEIQNLPYQFKEGDKVIYVPVFANGDINHPNCERGVVSSVSGSGHNQNVWVRYTEGSTGAKTAYDCLVLDV